MTASRMTDAEISEALRSDTPLNRARRAFSSSCGLIEQSAAQGASIFEIRRLEFEAVQKIAEQLGLEMPK